MFVLHERLAADTVPVARWELCDVLLCNDANFTWLILVPRRDGLKDFHDLARADWPQAMAEIERASKALQAITAADKLNVAALGNMVPQLHIHVIARHKGDAAWPGPIWGKLDAKPYGAAELSDLTGRLLAAFEAAGNP
jgi:diadenosine tetraphosphate (Ap4A) HIT family hydrolase